MSSETLLNSLLQDLNRLYNDADDYDVIIQVGEGPNSEDFKAHSNILRVRSTYFKAALSSNWKKSEENTVIFKKPNINPSAFKIILKYIYTGAIDLDVSILELGELLIAADEINLEELIYYIQYYITTLNQEWPEKDIIKMFNMLSCHQIVFNILYIHFKELISKNSERFFNDSNNLFIELENDALLSLIQYDCFDMEEIDIWDNLVKWAIARNPAINSNKSLWKSEEKEIIKQAIQDFIPHIRFYQISSQNYYHKIRPLSALLPKELDEGIISHFLVPENSQNSKFLPPRKLSKLHIDSGIIKMDHIYQISHWINKKQDHVSEEFQYEFNLLLRGSRDGFDIEPFREKCYNEGATIVVIKLEGEDRIIGGYNPLSWGGTDEYLQTDDSFIFSFLQSNLSSSITILSRVKGKRLAVFDSSSNGQSFGEYDLEIFKKRCVCKQYETKIIEAESFGIEDYEVFQIKKE